jgi:hypothetical protein
LWTLSLGDASSQRGSGCVADCLGKWWYWVAGEEAAQSPQNKSCCPSNDWRCDKYHVQFP